MRSPGRPPVARREHRQRFWTAIARGVASEDAGVEAGVSPAVGSRWFRECGGMPPSDFRPHSGLIWVSLNVRRSRSAAHMGTACGRSPGICAGRRRRSRASCAGTRRGRFRWTFTSGHRTDSADGIAGFGCKGTRALRWWPILRGTRHAGRVHGWLCSCQPHLTPPKMSMMSLPAAFLMPVSCARNTSARKTVGRR